MEELWRDIEGYEGFYQISNTGKVKSLDKYRPYKQHKRLVKGKVLKICNCLGYRILTLCKNSVKISFRVHRLVAQAFIPNPDNKPYVNHIDGNKTNNNDWNLEWTTASENTLHSIHILKNKTNKGSSWTNHKFTLNECLEMIKLYKEGINFNKIALKFNSNHNTISKIIRNEKYNY